MGLSSMPTAGPVVTAGASATGLSVTAIASLTVALLLPSWLVVVTVSTKSSSLSGTGMTCKADRSQPVTLAVVEPGMAL